MLHVELDQEEQEILSDILANCLSDLSYEIADTDNMDYRERLKVKRQVLEKISAALTRLPPDLGL